jgi:hypothetical protein
VLGRLVVATEPRERGAQVRARVDPLGVLLERRLVELDGADDVARLVQGHRTREQGVGVGERRTLGDLGGRGRRRTGDPDEDQ